MMMAVRQERNVADQSFSGVKTRPVFRRRD